MWKIDNTGKEYYDLTAESDSDDLQIQEAPDVLHQSQRIAQQLWLIILLLLVWVMRSS
jgi:hypothetical protein